MGKDHIEFVFDDAKATIISRGEERDQPDGERTIPRCVTAFNAITGHSLSNCDGWLFMEILKKCRSVQGRYKYDDYRDGVGYAALRAEEARMEHEADKDRAEVLEQILVPKPGDGKLVAVCDCLDPDCEAKGRPGQVIKICKHNRSNCYECGMTNTVDVRPGPGGVIVPPECDTRGSHSMIPVTKSLVDDVIKAATEAGLPTIESDACDNRGGA